MLACDSPLHMSTSLTDPLPDNSPPVYDARGRQKNFVESAVQRRERIQFLKQREWVRRVTEWVRETNAQKDSVRVPIPISISLVLTRLLLSQFSVVQADHSFLSQPRTLASRPSHPPSLSPAWKRREKKSPTLFTVHLPTPPSPPFPRKSLLFFPSIVVHLPHLASPSQAYPNLPREDQGITEDAVAPVFAAIRANNLFPVYAKCLKRTRCLPMPPCHPCPISAYVTLTYLALVSPGKLDSSREVIRPFASSPSDV